jgi:proteasome-associated ATPase
MQGTTMSDHRTHDSSGDKRKAPNHESPRSMDSLSLLDECLAAFDQDDPRQRILYKLRHLLLQEGSARHQRDADFNKLNAVVEKLTAPANRIGILLELPGEGLARILVGGAEYYTNVDPRVERNELRIGTQILVNEAYALIKALGYDRSGPVMKVSECLPDGRIRFEQDPGRQALILPRSTDLAAVELKAGDEVRVDPSHRIALERLAASREQRHRLEEIPSVTWDQIGGQRGAIDAIRRAIEYPLLHGDTFQKYQFTQPKGFLLYGPPGCGKTLIGQATAACVSRLLQGQSPATATPAPVKGGIFLHIKGPEILNMWLGESERLVRDLFAEAKARRQDGYLPFVFIDEAESILGTRRAMRSFNISNTLVPMFCAEMDGIESLRDVVIILASNRPDLIDPAVLRPGRIDRKIKVGRPGREEAAEILRVYLTDTLPLDPALIADAGDRRSGRERLVQQTLDFLFRRSDDSRLLAIRLRSGQQKVLYRGDILSGAVLAAIVRRAKEQAVERAILAKERTEADGSQTESGITSDDLLAAVQAEYREGEILPPDEAAEEWLKLLDYHPDQVVGITSFRRGRASEERLVAQII